MTSDHAVLFTKENCPPCALTKEHLTELLTDRPGLGMYISVLKKENHSQLIEEYKLDLFPTLIVVDSMGEEITRIVGGKAIRADLSAVLNGLRILDRK